MKKIPNSKSQISNKFKIKNLKLKIPAKQGGFTLIETLVVVALLSTVGLIIAVILYASLRGGEKTKLIFTAKENGNYAISIFSRETRFANAFYGLSTSTDPNNFKTNFCDTGLKYPNLKVQNSSNQQLTFSCTATGISLVRDGKPAENLINASQIGVVPNSCGFSCKSATAIGSYTVGLSFQLIDRFSVTPSAVAQNVFIERRLVSPIQFDTSVTLRNSGN